MTVLRRFGRTEREVSPLTLGTSSWGPLRPGEAAAERDDRVLRLARAFFAGELGTTVLDTSNMYGVTAEGALSEVLLGRAITQTTPAPGLLIQTKLDRDPRDDRFDGARMWDSLAESRERLGIAQFPVLYLHDPEVIGFDAAMAPGGPVEALVAMRDEGVAAAIGISGGPVGMLQRFVETDLFDALITHNRYTLVDRSADALLDSAVERDLGIANAAPYGAGVLTGNPRFAGSYGYRPVRPETQRAIDQATAIAAKACVPLSALALQFSLRDPRIHTTIAGASSLESWQRVQADAATVIPEEVWEGVTSLDPGIGLDD